MMLAIILTSISAFSQSDKKFIRKGNRQYDKGNYPDSEILYRKAGEQTAQSPDYIFNIGDALYKQGKYEDSGRQFSDYTNQTLDAEKQSAGWYNLGNSLLQSKMIKESIEAYKNSLKLDPDNKSAKYNLGYAQDLLKEQEQQQQQQQQQNNNQQEQQDNNQEKNQGENQDQQSQPQQQKQQPEEQEMGISKEDAERLLDALANDEKAVQEKVKREKASRTRTRTLKNW